MSETQKKSPFPVKALLVVIVAAFIGFYIPSHISFGLTDSLNKHVFFIMPYSSDNELEKGDHIVFRLTADHEVIKKSVAHWKTDRAIKIVACAGGSFLKVDKYKDYYCDGEYIGRARDAGSDGVPVKNFVYYGTIEAGDIFVMGQRNSFDSRYFGFVKTSDVLSKAYPIF